MRSEEKAGFPLPPAKMADDVGAPRKDFLKNHVGTARFEERPDPFGAGLFARCTLAIGPVGINAGNLN